MRIKKPPIGGHFHIEYHFSFIPSYTPSPLRGPLPLKGTQERSASMVGAFLDTPFGREGSEGSKGSKGSEGGSGRPSAPVLIKPLQPPWRAGKTGKPGLRPDGKKTVAPLPSAHSAPALAGERWWRQPPKGASAGMVQEAYDSKISRFNLSFPLEGNAT